MNKQINVKQSRTMKNILLEIIISVSISLIITSFPVERVLSTVIPYLKPMNGNLSVTGRIIQYTIIAIVVIIVWKNIENLNILK